MIDPLIKIVKRRLGDRVEVLYYMDDLKASMTDIKTAQIVHAAVKKYAMSVGMVINNKKSAIQLNVDKPIPVALQEIPKMDETTYKYLGFEMKKGEVDRTGCWRSWKSVSKKSLMNQRRELKSSRRETGSTSLTRM